MKCSCLFDSAMGLPCRHICAVNGGASLEDISMRWLMEVHLGCADDVFLEHAGEGRHEGALATSASANWYVTRALRSHMHARKTNPHALDGLERNLDHLKLNLDATPGLARCPTRTRSP